MSREGIEGLVAEIEKLMDSKGVSSFIFILNDPDSDGIASTQEGPLLWRIGALEVMRREAVESWEIEREG